MLGTSTSSGWHSTLFFTSAITSSTTMSAPYLRTFGWLHGSFWELLEDLPDLFPTQGPIHGYMQE